jgi:hypothetical protein
VRSKSAAARKAFAMSRVSNGRDILPSVDNRTAIARRYRDIASAILSDQLADQCSEARRQLIRRFAAASVLAEEMEAELARGEKIDISEHALLCSSLVRIANKLGLERRSKNITPPSVRDYVASIQEAAE